MAKAAYECWEWHESLFLSPSSLYSKYFQSYCIPNRWSVIIFVCVCVCVETEGCPRRLCKSKNSIEHLLCASIYLGTLSNTLRVLHNPSNTSMGYTHFTDEKTRFRDWVICSESDRARIGTHIFLITEPVISSQCHTNWNWQVQEWKAY